MENEKKLPFTDHLEELRKRIIISIVAVGVGFLVSYAFSQEIFAILARPLQKVMPPESTLIFTALPEAFFIYLKTSLLAGIFIASPVVLYQICRFVTPGLYKNEKRYILPFAFFSTLLFVGGALFGYFVVFPIGFKFFLSFGSETLRPLPSIKEYLSLTILLITKHQNR